MVFVSDELADRAQRDDDRRFAKLAAEAVTATSLICGVRNRLAEVGRW